MIAPGVVVAVAIASDGAAEFPPQMTKVLSSRPRCFRSLSNSRCGALSISRGALPAADLRCLRDDPSRRPRPGQIGLRVRSGRGQSTIVFPCGVSPYNSRTRSRFFGKIKRVGRFDLHAIGHLEGFDACFELRIPADSGCAWRSAFAPDRVRAVARPREILVVDVLGSVPSTVARTC